MTLKTSASIAVAALLASFALYNSNLPTPGSYLVGQSLSVSILDPNFMTFIQQYNKQYLSGSEIMRRLKIFIENDQFIRQNNAMGGTAQYGHNIFSDMTEEERAGLTGLDVSHIETASDKSLGVFTGTEAPSSGFLGASLQAGQTLDWRTRGAVTPVQNQMSCGSCYAFSSAAAMEGAYFIKTGNLVKLSEQQLADCTGSYGNTGCGGGYMTNCFEYLKSYKLMTGSSYPYTGRGTGCKQDSSKGVVGTTGYKMVDKTASALMAAVNQQPVSIAVAATTVGFFLYRSGVVTSNCGSSINHAVTLVGYGTLNGIDYWLVKNSWGTSWGDQGYIKIARTEQYPGLCGILMLNSFPVL